MSKDKPSTTPAPDEQPNVVLPGFSIGKVMGRHYDGDKIVTEDANGRTVEHRPQGGPQ